MVDTTSKLPGSIIGRGVASAALATLREPEPRHVGELADKMRLDYQVKLAELTLGANIQAASVTISVEGDDRARLLTEHLQQLWDASLPSMLGAIAEGRVAFEKVWDYHASANLSYIRKLEPLPFAPTRLRLTARGAFDGIDLQCDGQHALVIPPDNSWWLALDPSPIAPHGRSRFLGAPLQVWKERREAIRLRQVFLKKLVVSGGVAHVPDELQLENGQSVDVFAETARAYNEWLAGGLMIFPNTRDRDGRYAFDYTDLPHTLDPAPLDSHIDGLDQEQLQSFGVPPKTVLEGASTGSHAMVSQQMLTLFAVCEDILKQFEASFQKYVIDKALQANFPPARMPRIDIDHEPLDRRSASLAEEVVKQVLAAPHLNPLLSSGVINVPDLLRAAGVPLGSSRDKVTSKGGRMRAEGGIDRTNP